MRFLIFLLLFAAPGLAETRVIDGDTIEVDGETIRLHGIDAPEKDQLCLDEDGEAYKCGEVVAVVLQRFLAGKAVTCETMDVDRYQRIVAKCSADSVDIGAALVGAGLAVAFSRYSKDYVADEDAARIGRKGMWAGRFNSPADWRRR